MGEPSAPRRDTVVATADYQVTPEMVSAYAEISGDLNPIHLSEAAARARGFSQPIAHGHIILGFVSDLAAAHVEGWFEGAAVAARFRRPVPCDVTVHVRLLGNDADNAGADARYRFECLLPDSEVAVFGTLGVAAT